MMEMKLFIGTKTVLAGPMTRGEHNKYRGWGVPTNTNIDQSEEGRLVEYIDGGAPNHPDHDGYISWSPAPVFDGAYSEIEKGMGFPHALSFNILGEKITRKAWPKSKYFGPGLTLHVGKEHVEGCAVQAEDALADDWILVK